MSKEEKEKVKDWERFWRKQASRGKLRRYKPNDLHDKVDSVFKFFQQYGFDSNGLHLFTDKTYEAHTFLLGRIAEGALDDPAGMPYVKSGSEHMYVYFTFFSSLFH